MLCTINGVQFGIGRLGEENEKRVTNVKGGKKTTEIRDSNRKFILEKVQDNLIIVGKFNDKNKKISKTLHI